MPSRPESSPSSAILSPSPSCAQQPVGGDPDVVEVHRRRGRAGQAHLLLGRVGGEAGRIRGDEEAGDPVALVRRPRHHLVEVGEPAVRGPRLRPLDDPLVAVAAGGGAHRRRVGAGVRLGEAVGAEELAAEHVGQPRLLLLLGPAGHEPEARERMDRDAHADRGPHRADLLEHLEVDLVGQPAAAVLLRVGQPQQAGAAEHREHVTGERRVRLGGGRPRRELVGRDLPDELQELG